MTAEATTRDPRTGQTYCVATGKQRYKSEASAERMMARLIVHGAARHVLRRAYSCEFCGGWHLTKQEKRA